MMLADPSELLDLQIEFLRKQEGLALMAQVGRYLDSVTSDPRVRTLFGDLLHEAEDAELAFGKLEKALVDRLCAIRDALIAMAPSIDDSTRQHDPNIGFDHDYDASFAHFNSLVAKVPDRVALDPSPGDEDIFVPRLLRIIQGKWQAVAKIAKSPELFALGSEEGAIAAEHQHAFQAFLLIKRSDAGAAAARLRAVVDRINPTPGITDEDRMMWNLRVGMNDILSRLYGRSASSSRDDREALEREIAAQAAQMLSDAESVHVELRRRLYTTRSRRALLERFKIRCESYDRDRLRALAEVAGKPETPLTLEAARFLFDNGLTPLIDASSGGLKPDLLDTRTPWTFYLESKQYGDAAGARKAVRGGAKQVWDTALHLKSLGVTEVFWLVFRRGGPLCLVPEELRAEGLVVFPILIDIAPTAESGSRQKEKPISFTATDLAPDAVTKEHSDDK
jgi:hypothetical protein